MNAHYILIAARSKIDKPQKWCKGSYALNGRGEEVGASTSSACRHCAEGAIMAVDPLHPKGLTSGAALDARIALRDGIVVGDSITGFNDNPRTKHKEVMALYDRAIEATRSSA